MLALRGALGPPWKLIDVVEETGSTNADLLVRAAAGEDIDGAALLAESQTAGRGRHGRTWTAPPPHQLAVNELAAAVAVDAEDRERQMLDDVGQRREHVFLGLIRTVRFSVHPVAMCR